MKSIWIIVMMTLPIVISCSNSTAESIPIKESATDGRALLRSCVGKNISIEDDKRNFVNYFFEADEISIRLIKKEQPYNECSESLSFFPRTNDEKWDARFSSDCENSTSEKSKKLSLIINNCLVAKNLILDSKIIMYQSLERGIQFPEIIRHINTSETWPQDLYDYINKNRGETPGDTMDAYGSRLQREIVDSNLLNSFEDVFKSNGCDISTGGGRSFAEIIWGGEKDAPSQRLPSYYSKDELIKAGIFSPVEASKKYYPAIEWVNFNLDCERIGEKP